MLLLISRPGLSSMKNAQKTTNIRVKIPDIRITTPNIRISTPNIRITMPNIRIFGVRRWARWITRASPRLSSRFEPESWRGLRTPFLFTKHCVNTVFFNTGFYDIKVLTGFQHRFL